MSEEIKDTLIVYEKEPEIKFSLTFKLILAASIVLTGLLSLFFIPFLIVGIKEQIWDTKDVNIFLSNALFLTSVVCCFISLINIAIIKKPFSNILVWCTMIVGMLFVISSFVFPRFPGYDCSFTIYRKGSFILCNGTLLLIGLLGVLFSKVIKYGFIYQKNSDTTI
ncbi:MAG: hypothetical protein K0R50_3859 [Eubacterium sp.]|nr:hypothetical protein [Eubacterium sp.]